MNKKIQLINYYFLLTLLIFVPFQALFLNIFEAHSHLSSSRTFWLGHWYEPVLLILLLVTVIQSLNKLKKDRILMLSLFLLVIGVLSSFAYQPLSRGIEGFRFTLFGVLVFILTYLSNITVDQRKRFLNVYLFLAVIISVWAVIEMLLPGKYWGEWGIIQKDLVWGYGWHTVGSLNQLASFLGGPNQLASYLLPAFFVAIFGAIEASTNKQKKQFYYGLFLIILFASVILFTFSRSAAIGMFFGLLLIPFIKGHNLFLRRGVIFLVIALSVLGLLFYDQNNPILTHGQSQSGHIEALNQSLTEIGYRFNHQPIKLIIGDGLGSAGPLAIKYQDGLVSESWYLQLFLEIGLIGVIIWLSIVILIIKKLVKKKQLALAVGLVSISITALFLHTWADNPAMTYSLFILLGVNLKEDK